MTHPLMYEGYPINIRIKDREFQPGQRVRIFFRFTDCIDATVLNMENKGWVKVRDDERGAEFSTAVGMTVPLR